MKKYNINFLPFEKGDIEKRGYKKADILFITPDAYIDIPSLAIPLLGRFLERKGYLSAIISRPKSKKDMEIHGSPKYAIAISGGIMDSMLYHYTAFLKTRSEDPLSDDEKIYSRPKRTIIEYTSMVKGVYKDIPIIIGGIEASMRRFTHYDYWSGKIRKPILVDSKADILVFGMGEYPILKILNRLKEKKSLYGLRSLQFVFHKKQMSIWKEIKKEYKFIQLPSYEDIMQNKELLIKQALLLEEYSNPYLNTGLYQRVGDNIVVSFPPPLPLSEKEMDFIYDAQFIRKAHPFYKRKFDFLEMSQFSITTHRGCFGGCSFCAITLHQGRFIQSRSEKSILKEVKSLIKHSDFKGTITDVGGPSANMYKMKGKNIEICKKCRRPSCIYPTICSNLDTKHYHKDILYKIKSIKGIKHIKVSSGIRYDLALEDKEYISSIATAFSPGRLKIAPEHTDEKILKLMRKPPFAVFEKFLRIYKKYTNKPIILYMITGFPGSTKDINDKMYKKLKNMHLLSNQHQSFTPTPLTLSTAYFVAEKDEKGNKLFVPSLSERIKQWKKLIHNS